MHTTSRGSTSPDGARRMHSGPGPITNQLAFVRLLADYLEATAGEVSDTGAVDDPPVRQLR